MPATRTFAATLLFVGIGAALAAQAPALDLKLGLWEHTIVTSISGMPPVDTTKMTPEQAARMEAAMKAMGGEHSNTQKHCLTKEELSKDSFMMPESTGMTCKRTIATNTSSSFVAEVTCSGEQEMKGQMSIDSLSGGTAFKGTAKMAATRAGRTMNVALAMSGKYLGADCGTIK
jgi:hypothetical protein